MRGDLTIARIKRGGDNKGMVGSFNFSSTFYVGRIVLGAASLLVSLSAHSASTCQAQKNFPNSDMRKDFGPIRDQGSMGWCYAYGAADQAGYWLKKNRGMETTSPGNMISASAVALDYNGEERSKSLGASDAIRRVQAATAELTKEAMAKQSRQREIFNSKLSAFVARDKRAADVLERVGDRQAKQAHDFMEQAKLNPATQNGMIVGGGMGGGMGAGMGSGVGAGYFKPSAADMFDPYSYDTASEKDKSEFKKLVLKDPTIDTEYKKLLYHQNELSALVSIYPKSVAENEGGDPKTVLDNIMGNGFCTEEEVPSEGFDYQAKTAPMQGYVPPGYTMAPQKGVKAILNEGVGKYTASPNAENLCEATEAAKGIFPKLSQKEISDVLETSRKNDNDAVDQLLKAACKKKKIELPRPVVTSETVITAHDKGMNAVQDLLKKGTPVGITYYPEVLSENPLTYDKASKEGTHYSVLVGQRYNCDKGEPEYILRNSWGKSSCETGSAAYKSRFLANEAPYSCEDGYYIIPESQLKMGLLNMTYYE